MLSRNRFSARNYLNALSRQYMSDHELMEVMCKTELVEVQNRGQKKRPPTPHTFRRPLRSSDGVSVGEAKCSDIAATPGIEPRT